MSDAERNSTLYDIFNATMTSDKQVRSQAEEALVNMSMQDPWLIVHLLTFCTTVPEEGDPDQTDGTLTQGVCVRLAAAVRLRNVIDKENWNKSDFFSHDCRSQFKNLLLEVIVHTHVHDKILKQLITVVQSIVGYDWRHNMWEELVPRTLQHLDTARAAVEGSDSQLQMVNGLKGLRAATSILRSCCKKHEDQTLWSPEQTDDFAANVIPVLVDLLDFCSARYNDLLGYAVEELPSVLQGYEDNTGSRKAEMLFQINPPVTVLDEVTRFALKSCWSLTKARFPLVLCSQEGLDRFLSALATIWNQTRDTYCGIHTSKLLAMFPVLRLSQRDVSDEMQTSSSWKKMKWVANIVHHMLCEFILPKQCEQRARDAAHHFLNNYLEGFIELAFHAIQWHHSPGTASGVQIPHAGLAEYAQSPEAPQKLCSKFYIMCVTLLDVGTGNEALYTNVIHPKATTLLTSLLFERLCYTPEDDELWQFNPEEYIRKQTDPRGDDFNPKKTSMSCTIQLVIPAMPFHDTTLLMSYVQHITGLLEAKFERLNNEGGFDKLDEEEYLVIDACLFAMSQLRRALSAVEVGSEYLENIMMKMVLPLLECPKGYIRARSVFVLARFAKRIEWSHPDNYQRIVQAVLGACKDEELPVRIQTCSVLSKFIRHEMARPVVEPVVADVVQHYFEVMRQMDNEGVIRTLRKIIKFYGHTLAQWALDLCTMIVDHFAVLKTDIEKREEEIDNDIANAAEDMNENAAKDGLGGLGGTAASDVFDTIAAADELIITMNTLVRSIPHTEESRGVFSAIQKALAPMFHAILGQPDKSYGFMDKLLALLNDLASHSDVIDDSIWTLLPLLSALAVNHAPDYFAQIVCPIDNMVSVDPASFLGRRDENLNMYYIEIFRNMCDSILDSSQRIRDISSATVLLDAVLLNVNLKELGNEEAKQVMDILLPVAMRGLQHPRGSSTFKVLFANSFLAALHAHAPAAIEFTRENDNCLTPFFARYTDLVLNTEYLHLREFDRKVFLMALIAMLDLVLDDSDGNYQDVAECLVNIITSDVLPSMASQDRNEIRAKFNRLKKLMAKCNKKGINPRQLVKPIGASSFKYVGELLDEADELGGDDDEDDSNSDTDTDSEDDGFDGFDEDDGLNFDDDDDDDIENTEEYQKLLEQLDAEKHKLHAENDDDDDELDENLLIDDEVATPIDGINAWTRLGGLLMNNLEHPMMVEVINRETGNDVLGALHEDGGASGTLFDEREALLKELKAAAHRHQQQRQ